MEETGIGQCRLDVFELVVCPLLARMNLALGAVLHGAMNLVFGRLQATCTVHDGLLRKWYPRRESNPQPYR